MGEKPYHYFGEEVVNCLEGTDNEDDCRRLENEGNWETCDYGKEKETTYAWITNEMFDVKLQELIRKQSPAQLLAVEGLYELLTEHFNNQVLEELEKEKA